MKIGTKLAGDNTIGLYIGGIKRNDKGVINLVILRITRKGDFDNPFSKTPHTFSLTKEEFDNTKDWSKVLKEKLNGSSN